MNDHHPSLNFVRMHSTPNLEFANDFDESQLPKVRYAILACEGLSHAERLKIENKPKFRHEFKFENFVVEQLR